MPFRAQTSRGKRENRTQRLAGTAAGSLPKLLFSLIVFFYLGLISDSFLRVEGFQNFSPVFFHFFFVLFSHLLVVLGFRCTCVCQCFSPRWSNKHDGRIYSRSYPQAT